MPHKKGEKSSPLPPEILTLTRHKRLLVKPEIMFYNIFIILWEGKSMSTLIAYCGLDCAQCEAYQATQANDLAWQEKIVAKWRVDFNAPNMTVQDITCDGCRGPRLGGYCAMCEIRASALAHNVQSCADCPEYACAQLQKFFGMAPNAKENLEMLRPRN
jgi:hypothetical protein